MEEGGVSAHKKAPGAAGQRLRHGIDGALATGAACIPIPGAQAEEVAAAEGEVITLGVGKHLEEFTDMIRGIFRKGSDWGEWGKGDFKYQFLSVCGNPENQIHFNLTMEDGSMMNIWSAVHEGANVDGRCRRVTFWELAQIYKNGWGHRTTFWYKGQIVPNPFE